MLYALFMDAIKTNGEMFGCVIGAQCEILFVEDDDKDDGVNVEDVIEPLSEYSIEFDEELRLLSYSKLF